MKLTSNYTNKTMLFTLKKATRQTILISGLFFLTTWGTFGQDSLLVNSNQLIIDGHYKIKSNVTEKVIAAPNYVQGWYAIEVPKSDSDDQNWNFEHHGNNVYTVSVVSNGNRLEVPYAKTSNGTLVSTTDYSGAASNMTWKISLVEGAYILSPYHALNKALDIRPGDDKIQIWDIAPKNKNQHWSITAVDTFSLSVATNGINNTNKSKFALRPNPVSDVLNLQGLSKGDIVEIYDMQGRLVLETTMNHVSNNFKIPVNNLAAGIFMARIGNKNYETKKFVKK